MQIVGNSLVLFEGFLPAVAVDALQFAIDTLRPLAEVVDAAANLLPPRSARVWGERNVAEGFFGWSGLPDVRELVDLVTASPLG